jgi:MarR family transcriptional regulator, organic hydroperoxide resistance regulator
MSELAPLFRAHWATLAAEFDLTPGQGMALRRLEPGQPVPMNSLAGLLACDASNITGIVDKLEARGLIERQASPGDRRVKMLTVTARGAELRRRFIDRSSEPPAAIAGLPLPDLNRLAEILGRLVARYGTGGGNDRDGPPVERRDDRK